MFPFHDSKPSARDFEQWRFDEPSNTSGHDHKASSHFPTTRSHSQSHQEEASQHPSMHTALPTNTPNGLSRPSIVERNATTNSLLTDDGEDVVYQPQNDHPFLTNTENVGGPNRLPPGIVEFSSSRIGQPSLMGPPAATNISNSESQRLFAGMDQSRLGFPPTRGPEDLLQTRGPLLRGAAAAAAMARNQAEQQNASLKMLSAAVSAKRRWAQNQEQDAAVLKRKRARMEALMRYGGLVEARPGKFVRMVGTERARKAISRGKAKVVKCQACENSFQIHRRARVLYCKGCQHFTPLVLELEACANNTNKKRSSAVE